MATNYNMVELGVVDALGNLNVMYPITPSDAIACADGTLTKVLADNKKSVSTLSTDLTDLSQAVTTNKTNVDSSFKTVNNNITGLTNRCEAIEGQLKMFYLNKITRVLKSDGSYEDISSQQASNSTWVYTIKYKLPGVTFTKNTNIPVGIITLAGVNPSGGNKSTSLAGSFSSIGNMSVEATVRKQNYPSSFVSMSVAPINESDQLNINLVFNSEVSSDVNAYVNGAVSSFLIIV